LVDVIVGAEGAQGEQVRLIFLGGEL